MIKTSISDKVSNALIIDTFKYVFQKRRQQSSYFGYPEVGVSRELYASLSIEHSHLSSFMSRHSNYISYALALA